MNYTQHEFVKMNEVGSLITEAIQGVMDKLKDKDKMLTAHKSLIRRLETKSQVMQQEIVTLMKQSKQLPELYRKIKEVSGVVADNNNSMLETTERQAVGHCNLAEIVNAHKE